MNRSFNNASDYDQTMAVSLDVLRGQTMQRLAGVHQRLDSKGVSSVFTRSSKNPSNDGFFGGMFFSMILSELASASQGTGFHPMSHGDGIIANDFNLAAIAPAAIDAAVILRDENSSYHKYRNRQLSDYPRGRRNHALEEARKSKHRFNLVSGSHNNAFSFDIQAELACMYEILDMLDNLEQQGAVEMRVDKKQPIYNVLKQATKKILKKEPVRRFNSHIKMAL